MSWPHRSLALAPKVPTDVLAVAVALADHGGARVVVLHVNEGEHRASVWLAPADARQLARTLDAFAQRQERAT